MLEYYVIVAVSTSVGVVVGGYMASGKVRAIRDVASEQEVLIDAQAGLIRQLADIVDSLTCLADPERAHVVRAIVDSCRSFLASNEREVQSIDVMTMPIR